MQWIKNLLGHTCGNYDISYTHSHTAKYIWKTQVHEQRKKTGVPEHVAQVSSDCQRQAGQELVKQRGKVPDPTRPAD